MQSNMNDQWFKRYKNTRTNKTRITSQVKTILFIAVFVGVAVAVFFLAINLSKPSEPVIEKVEFIESIQSDMETSDEITPDIEPDDSGEMKVYEDVEKSDY